MIGIPSFSDIKNTIFKACLQCITYVFIYYLHIKYFNIAVIGGSAEKERVWREGKGANGHGMALKRMQQLARLQVEDVDETIDAGTRQILAIRTLQQSYNYLPYN